MRTLSSADRPEGGPRDTCCLHPSSVGLTGRGLSDQPFQRTAMSDNPTHFPVGANEPMLTLTRRTYDQMFYSRYFSANEFTTATPKLWAIELHNGAHNVLALTFVNDAIRPALDAVEEEWRKSLKAARAKGKSAPPDEGKGALIIIGKRDQNKFFSNGEVDLSTLSGSR